MDHLIKRPSDANFTIAIIRHSERPSFDNIPVEKQNDVTITERGVEAAKNFGKAVVLDAGIKNLRAYHWGLKRCVDTADAIALGAGEVGCTINERNGKHLMSPIADREAYDTALKRGQWIKLLHDWQATEEGHIAMVPVKKYASEIFAKILSVPIPSSGELTVIATHDLQIFPLLSSVFGGEFNNIGYLEGLVISRRETEILLGFDGKLRTASLSELIQQESTKSPQV